MHYVGKIDRIKIGEYAKRIITDNVILTNGRKMHILEEHRNDYEIIIKNIDRVILNPNEVLVDSKNEDTLFFIDNLERNKTIYKNE